MEQSAAQKIRMSDMTVESIMTSAVHTVTLKMTVLEAIQMVLSKKIHGAPVVDNSNLVVSVISEGNLLKLAAFSGLDTKIAACLDKLPKPDKLITAKKTDTVTDIYKQFLTHQIHRIIIIDGMGKLQGIVSRSNVLQVFISSGGAT